MKLTRRKKKSLVTASNATNLVASGVAAYLAYRVFKKQKPALHGLLDRVVGGVSSKLVQPRPEVRPPEEEGA